MELCAGAAWIEALGYVHGDIRPPNLLLDRGEYLRLADFDCVAPIGTPSETSTTPWVRLLGPEAGAYEGTFGLCGPQTEQCAIGSVLYCLTRGYEPYEIDELEDITEPLDLFQRMEFPPLGDGDLDFVIGMCWRGDFSSLENLAEHTRSLCCEGLLQPASAPEHTTDIRDECQRLVDNGLLVFN